MPVPLPIALPTTAWVLLAANLVPLVGVLAWGWQVDAILWLYWLENIVVGVLTLARITWARGPWRLKAFLLPFFTVHFGLFCLVHGVFIGVIVAGRGTASPGDGLRRALALEPDLAVPLAALALAHLVAFFVHDMGGGRLTQSDAGVEMVRPYGRILLLHTVVLLGAGLAMAFDSPLPALVVLVLLKIGIDVVAQRRAQGAPAVGATGPGA